MEFIELGYDDQPWAGMCGAANGDVYVGSQDDIYKQSGDPDNNFLLEFTGNYPQSCIFAMAAAPNGDIYASYKFTYVVLKQTGGAGPFVNIAQTSFNRQIYAMTVTDVGDLYVATSNYIVPVTPYESRIYKQTAGSGPFGLITTKSNALITSMTSYDNNVFYTYYNIGGNQSILSSLNDGDLSTYGSPAYWTLMTTGSSVLGTLFFAFQTTAGGASSIADIYSLKYPYTDYVYETSVDGVNIGQIIGDIGARGGAFTLSSGGYLYIGSSFRERMFRTLNPVSPPKTSPVPIFLQRTQY